MWRQPLEYGRPATRVDTGGQKPARLVIQEKPRALAARQRRAVNADAVGGGEVERGRIDHGAIDGDAAGGDPLLGLAARREPGAGDHLGNAFAGFEVRVRGHLRLIWACRATRVRPSAGPSASLCWASASLYTATDRHVDGRIEPVLTINALFHGYGLGRSPRSRHRRR